MTALEPRALRAARLEPRHAQRRRPAKGCVADVHRVPRVTVLPLVTRPSAVGKFIPLNALSQASPVHSDLRGTEFAGHRALSDGYARGSDGALGSETVSRIPVSTCERVSAEVELKLLAAGDRVRVRD